MTIPTEAQPLAERGNTTTTTLTEKLARVSAEIENGLFSSESLQKDKDILLTKREVDTYWDGITAALSEYSKRIGNLTSEETDTNIEEQVTNSIYTTRFKLYRELARSDLDLEEKLLRLFMHGVEVVQAHWNTIGKEIFLQNIRNKLIQRSRSTGEPTRRHSTNEENGGKKKEEEEPPSPPVLTPPPEPPPSPEPAPEKIPETPSFSRYLKDILADPSAPEAMNLLNKLKSDNGRLWIDKKKADGTAVRIWLSLGLTPEDMAKPKKEIDRLIGDKLQIMSLKVRIDDPSKGPSWKDRWTSKKNAITDSVQQLKNNVETKSDPTATIAEIVTKIDITDDEQKMKFTAFLRDYLKKDGAKDDIWTCVRNAYWHSGSWEGDLTKVSRDLGTTFALPTYEKTRVKTWEKIDARTNALLTPTGRHTVRMQGQNAAEYQLTERQEAAGKISYHFVGLGWVQGDNLRICEKKEKQPYDSWKAAVPAVFEFMAWRAQPEKPEGTPATSPLPTPKGPTPPPQSPKKAHPAPPIAPPPPPPVGGKKVGPDTTPTASPPLPSPLGKVQAAVVNPPAAPKTTPAPAAKPAESSESAESWISDLIKQFKRYVEKKLRTGTPFESDDIYDEFYAMGDKNYQQNDFHPQGDTGLKKFARYIGDTLTNAWEAKKENGTDKPTIRVLQGKFLHCEINGGYISTKPLGRFYLNFVPQSMLSTFKMLAMRLHDAGIRAMIKVQNHIESDKGSTGTKRNLNRRERCVIYVNEKDTERVLQILQKLYGEHPDYFDTTGIPRFTAGMTTENGKDVMRGVGFAEEPSKETKKKGAESFGELVARVLWEVYLDWKHKEFPSTFDWKRTFEEKCKRMGMDPQYPPITPASLTAKTFEGILSSLRPHHKSPQP